MHKICTGCGVKKQFDGYYKDKTHKDGLQSICKDCIRSRVNRYRHSLAGKIARKKYRSSVVGTLRHRFSIMKDRCGNSKYKEYQYYGGRGIQCKFKDSQEFVDYVVGVLQVDPRGLQIDRIDNNGHYEPGNIRFVTAKENCNNRRSCKS